MGKTKAGGSLFSALPSGAPGALISMKNYGEGSIILPHSCPVVTDILDTSSKLEFKNRAVVFFFFFSFLVINRNSSLMETFNLKWNLI